jgi:hypothetical protein
MANHCISLLARASLPWFPTKEWLERESDGGLAMVRLSITPKKYHIERLFWWVEVKIDPIHYKSIRFTSINRFDSLQIAPIYYKSNRTNDSGRPAGGRPECGQRRHFN